MSRRCPQCPRTRMRDGRVHVHELAREDWFRFPGDEEPLQVESKGVSGVTVRGRARHERVRFVDSRGRVKDFPARPRASRRISGGAEVIPLEEVSDAVH